MSFDSLHDLAKALVKESAKKQGVVLTPVKSEVIPMAKHTGRINIASGEDVPHFINHEEHQHDRAAA